MEILFYRRLGAELAGQRPRPDVLHAGEYVLVGSLRWHRRHIPLPKDERADFRRARRVKCDEGKPGCLRCKRYGSQCGGYRTEIPKRKIVGAAHNSLRTILPNTQSRHDLIHKSAILPHSPGKRPSVSFFANELEHRYFRLFWDKVSLQLSGFFDSDIWRQLILQVSEMDESVRHAIVAVGALDMTIESAKVLTVPELSILNKHHQFALLQYSKAL